MKYVEAMILDPDTTEQAEPLKFEPDVRELKETIVEARELISADPSDIKPKEWADALDSIVQLAEILIEDAMDHECGCDHEVAEDPVPLVPVGEFTSIQAQLERIGLNRGDEVAIVRLSDLRALMERTKP